MKTMSWFAGIRLATIVALTLVIFAVDSTAAKRGCSNFGHSCFGGHGKRSNGGELEEMPAGGIGGAPYDQQLVFTGPRSAPLGDLVDDAAGGPPPTSYRELRLSPFLRQWLQAFRASQDYRQNNM